MMERCFPPQRQTHLRLEPTFGLSENFALGFMFLNAWERRKPRSEFRVRLANSCCLTGDDEPHSYGLSVLKRRSKIA